MFGVRADICDDDILSVLLDLEFPALYLDKHCQHIVQAHKQPCTDIKVIMLVPQK